MTERWLLLGATGRVGRMLRRHWAERPPEGAEIIAQSRQAGPGLWQWDPLDPGPDLQADVVLGFAGVVPGPGADLGLNVRLGQAAVRMADHVGARRVLLASSSSVYGPGTWMGEGHYCAPVNPYGEAKLAMEAAVAGSGIQTCCLRIGNVAWADALLGRMEPGKRVALDRFRSGGGPLRSYIGPRTLADVLETLARYDGTLPPVLNVAAPTPVRMEALLRAAGRAWDWTPAPISAVEEVTLDCSQLASVHGFAATAGSAEVLIAEGMGVKDGA